MLLLLPLLLACTDPAASQPKGPTNGWQDPSVATPSAHEGNNIASSNPPVVINVLRSGPGSMVVAVSLVWWATGPRRSCQAARQVQALCCWPLAVAWHMGAARKVHINSGDYTNMGLRVDSLAGETEASNSAARRSYFAYSRLALLFGADVGVSVLHPPIPSHSDLKLEEPTPPGSLAGTAPWAADDGDVWIFEFTGLPDLGEIGGRSLGTDYTHGYLLMLDPVADGPATKEIPAAAAASADPLRLKPFVEYPEEWLDDSVEPDETTLPAYDMAAVMADPDILSDLVLPADVPLNRGGQPFIILAKGPVAFFQASTRPPRRHHGHRLWRRPAAVDAQGQGPQAVRGHPGPEHGLPGRALWRRGRPQL